MIYIYLNFNIYSSAYFISELCLLFKGQRRIGAPFTIAPKDVNFFVFVVCDSKQSDMKEKVLIFYNKPNIFIT